MENAIEVRDLTVTYNQKPVLWNIGFSLPKGMMAGIIGPNGSGKTTLLKSIMGLLSPDSGDPSSTGMRFILILKY